ncbi:MAG: hypothetical protein ABEI86_08445, partial [Halobacteriaceae archaeon]
MSWYNIFSRSASGDSDSNETTDPARQSIDRSVIRNPAMAVEQHNYDWDQYVPRDVPEYRQSNGEWDAIMAEIESLGQTETMPRFWVGGPTGAGKTHLAYAIANAINAPLI